MGPGPRAQSEADVGEEVVRFKQHIEANQPSADSHSITAHSKRGESMGTPPVLQNGPTTRQGRQKPGKCLAGRHKRWPAPEAVHEQSEWSNTGALTGSTLERAQASVCYWHELRAHTAHVFQHSPVYEVKEKGKCTITGNRANSAPTLRASEPAIWTRP